MQESLKQALLFCFMKRSLWHFFCVNLRRIENFKTNTMDKPIIYQLLPRLWGNINGKNIIRGSLEENGTGKF